VREGRLDEAVQDLEKALELEPESEVTRRTLAQALNARAVELANEESFDEALSMIRRGLDLEPHDAVLQRNFRSISNARKLNELMQGNPSAATLAQMLGLLQDPED
jgi:tetratricopeptide (TPR) repeat protein